MNKSMIAALVFAVCALGFLGAMGLRYSNAKSQYNEAASLWDKSASLRQQFVDTRAMAPAANTTPTKSVDLPTVMVELSKQLNIDNPEISKQGSARGQSRHSVTYQRLTIDTMGQLLEIIRKQHKYLTIRNIDASRSSGSSLSEFKWTLEIGNPED